MADLRPIRQLTQVEKDFAAWLALQSGRQATRIHQQAMLSRLMGTEVSQQDLLALKVDPEFRAYLKSCKRTEEASVAAARQLAHNMYSDGMKAHHKAIKELVKAKDWRGIPTATEPIWKRVVPIREEGTAPTKVTITLTTQRLADMGRPPIDVEVEELPPPDERTTES
jgi:hypothetical protein